MDLLSRKQSPRETRKWFSWKRRKATGFHIGGDLSDESDCEDDDMNEVLMSYKETGRCVNDDELRIFVGTWNVGGRSPGESTAIDLEEWLNPDDAADIYVLGFQEIVPLNSRTVIGAEDKTEANNWNVLISKAINEKLGGCSWLTPMPNPILSDSYCYSSSCPTPMRGGCNPSISSKYKLIASKKMVGVFISVWMRKERMRKHLISNVRVCSVACGMMGYLGNKGSVSVSMTIGGTSLCFIAAHLASGEKPRDRIRRNRQVSQIFRRTSFGKDHGYDCPLAILSHDRIFWFGDLNYRLFLEDDSARQLIQKQDWRGLREFDQLRRELGHRGVFQGWKEGDIGFPPTYKYCTSNCDRYSGGNPRRFGEKQRTPAWCDRILWHGTGVEQLSYLRGESKFSDHRPVSGLFSARIGDVEPPTNITARVVPLPAATAIPTRRSLPQAAIHSFFGT